MAHAASRGANVARPGRPAQLAPTSLAPSWRKAMAPQPHDVLVTDRSLLARVALADERALAELYDRYARLAFSLAIAVVGDAADAEEVVSDAFAQLWRSASSFDAERGSVMAWVVTIVRTRALDRLRAQRRRSRAIERSTILSEDGAGPLVPEAQLAERATELTEARALVTRALDGLPPTQRRVIELAYFGGLSQSEIAEQLSEPLGTVKTRMRGGMERMRTLLMPLMEPEP